MKATFTSTLIETLFLSHFSGMLKVMVLEQQVELSSVLKLLNFTGLSQTNLMTSSQLAC